MNGPSLPASPTPPPADLAQDLAEVRRALSDVSRRCGWIQSGPSGQPIKAALVDADARLGRVIELLLTAPPAM